MHKKKIFNLVIALKHTGQTFTLKNFFFTDCTETLFISIPHYQKKGFCQLYISITYIVFK